MWAAWSHEDRCPVNPVLVTRTLQCRASMPSPPTVPPGALSGCLHHMAGSTSMIHNLDTQPGYQHRNRGAWPPITGLVFYTGLPIGDRGHCRHLLLTPSRAQASTTPTSNSIHECSHFSPSFCLPSWSELHWSLASPLGPATLLNQDSPISTWQPEEAFYNPQTLPFRMKLKLLPPSSCSHTSSLRVPQGLCKSCLHVLFLTPLVLIWAHARGQLLQNTSTRPYRARGPLSCS